MLEGWRLGELGCWTLLIVLSLVLSSCCKKKRSEKIAARGKGRNTGPSTTSDANPGSDPTGKGSELPYPQQECQLVYPDDEQPKQRIQASSPPPEPLAPYPPDESAKPNPRRGRKEEREIKPYPPVKPPSKSRRYYPDEIEDLESTDPASTQTQLAYPDEEAAKPTSLKVPSPSSEPPLAYPSEEAEKEKDLSYPQKEPDPEEMDCDTVRVDGASRMGNAHPNDAGGLGVSAGQTGAEAEGELSEKKTQRSARSQSGNPHYKTLQEFQTDDGDTQKSEDTAEEDPSLVFEEQKRKMPAKEKEAEEEPKFVSVKKKKKKLRVHPKNPQYQTLRDVQNDIFGEKEELEEQASAPVVVVTKKKKKKLRVHPKNPQYETLRNLNNDIFGEEEDKIAADKDEGDAKEEPKPPKVIVVVEKKKKKLRVHPKNPQYQTLRDVQNDIFGEEESVSLAEAPKEAEEKKSDQPPSKKSTISAPTICDSTSS